MSLFKVQEVAQRLNCSISTVYSLIESGRLPHHRCPGVRISEEQINAYLKASERGPSTKRTPVCTGVRPRLKHIKLD